MDGISHSSATWHGYEDLHRVFEGHQWLEKGVGLVMGPAGQTDGQTDRQNGFSFLIEYSHRSISINQCVVLARRLSPPPSVGKWTFTKSLGCSG